MRLIPTLCLALVCLTQPRFAQAEPATADRAQSIKSGLEKYIGTGGPNGPSPVSVTPTNDAYRIQVDVKSMLHALEGADFSIDPTVMTMTATPQDDGKWHVVTDPVPAFGFRIKDSTYNVVINGSKYDGIFDPALPAFVRSNASYDSMSVGGTDGRGATQSRTSDHGAQDSTVEAAGDGAVKLDASQSNTDFTQDMIVEMPPAAPGPTQKGAEGQPTRISIKAGPTSDHVTVQDLRLRALADLWAFLVAHPTHETIKAAEPELRGLVRNALPLFKTWTQGGTLENLTVLSPIGPIAAGKATAQAEAAGLVSDGSISAALAVENLTLPPLPLPPWTAGLIPTAFEIDQRFSGFHLDAAAQEAVDNFNLDDKEPLAPEVLAKMKTLVGPLDQMTLTINPSHIVSALMDARFQGEVRFAQPIPSFKVDVHATGIDKVIASIQDHAAGDPTAAQVVAALVLAKGYGKADGANGLEWVVTNTQGGQVTINGLPLPQTKPH